MKEENEEIISKEKREMFITKFKNFLKGQLKEIFKAISENRAFGVDLSQLEKFSPEFIEFIDILKEHPETVFEISDEAVKQIDLPTPVKIRFYNLPETINIRDLRAKHLGKFISVEGIVRRASEIRPEIVSTIWECPNCGEKIEEHTKFGFVMKPFICPNEDCRNRRGFRQIDKKLIDMRKIVIEEPFELTEGEKPCQLAVTITEDLTSPDGRRMTDPGNRIKVTGILKDIPQGKSFSSILDFYLDANYIEPTEIGWEKLEISKEDEKKIKEFAKDPDIYKKLVKSLAPSLYGIEEIKEAIVLQLFGGVPRTMRDKTTIRGDIHILLMGDPASGKTQLMKLVPQIVPRGKYVSGKGVSTAGLTATVIRDEQFMGGWVLEAGAVVLANKGLLSVDEFEKMSEEDQVAMHEAMESGTVSIAKASIVATLPAQTSILAGGNFTFGRYDPAVSIKDQIKIPYSLLTRFDLKFTLKDLPSHEKDSKIVEHILKTRCDENYEEAKPKIDPDFIKKYIAYAKKHIKPELTEKTGKMLKDFYVEMRRKAEMEGAPVPISLRQFEALIRLAEASAKIQLSNKVRVSDVKRAIRLMEYSLRDLGFDTATQSIDIDKAEGGVPSSQRSKIRIIRKIIDELSAKSKEIKIEDIVKLAQKEGIDKNTAEEIIQEMINEGLLFRPNPGFVQKT